MAIKTQRIYYSARNYRTGLSDITANIYKDGVSNETPVATGLSLSELDATNAAGVYALEITPAQITGWGGKGTYTAKINSASRNAPAVVKFIVLENDEDDLAAQIVVVESKIDTLTSNVAAVQSDVTSIKATAESTNSVVTDVNVGNANLKALIEQAISAVSTIQNNTRFIGIVPVRMIVPGDVGTSNLYRLEMRLFNDQGSPEDPDLDQIQVSVENESGLDRTNLLVGFTSGPVDATKDGVGVYHIDIEISDTTAIEQLLIRFDYAENSVAFSQVRTSETVIDQEASGLALQATLLDVLTDTSDMQPRVVNIESLLNNPSFGLSALEALINIIDSVVDANNAELTDGAHGLAALKSILDTKSSQASVDAVNTAIQNDVKGAGFDPAEDSLAAQSARNFYGGSAL